MKDGKNRRRLIIGLAVSLFLLAGYGVAFVTMQMHNSLSEKHTIQYSAEVDSVRIWENKSGVDVCIRTRTPEWDLYIESSVARRIDLTPVHSLKAGDIVICRVISDTTEEPEFSEPGIIVALQIGDDVIFSLAERNAFMKEAASPTVIAACVLLGILACLAVGGGAALYRNKRKSA